MAHTHNLKLGSGGRGVGSVRTSSDDSDFKTSLRYMKPLKNWRNLTEEWVTYFFIYKLDK